MRINIYQILVTFLFVSFTSGAKNTSDNSSATKDPIIIPVWTDQDPPMDNGLTPEDEELDQRGIISNCATAELIIYPAEKPNGKTLLMCPGGGYEVLAINHEGNAMSAPLNDIGVTLAVLKYRMPNGHPDVPAEDARQALRILRENADILGINPDKIGIGGASAGGHLASTVATHKVPEVELPSFQVLLYPVISMNDSITHKGSKLALLGENPTDELTEYYSNELQVTMETPTAFIAVSNDDIGVPVENTLLYVNALRSNHIPVALHIYPTGGHGWGMNKWFQYHDVFIAELLTWLQSI